jgi:multidrug efflux pump
MGANGAAAGAAKIQRGFDRVIHHYDRALVWVLARQKLTLLVALATLVLTVLLYLAIPKGLFPTQDTGQLQVRVEAAQSISYPRMARAAAGRGTALLETRSGEPRQLRRRRRGQQHHAAHRPHAGEPEGRPRQPAEVMDRLRERGQQVAGVRCTCSRCRT